MTYWGETVFWSWVQAQKHLHGGIISFFKKTWQYCPSYPCVTTALSFLCFLHHDELGTTKQALMPNGLHQGLGGVPFSAGLGPFPRDNWHFCWKVKQYIPPGISRQSFAGCLAQRRPLQHQSWAGWDAPCLGPELTKFSPGRFKSHVVYRKKNLCVPWAFFVSFQFSRSLGSGHTVTFLSNLSSSWVQKKKCQKKYLKDSCSPVFSHYGLCEVETSFFFLQRWKKMHSCFKKKG